MANEVFMEPVTGVEKISKQRWKLVRGYGLVAYDEANLHSRNVVSVMFAKVPVYSVPKLLASLHFIRHAHDVKSYSCR